MLTPIGEPLPQDLQDCGHHILDTLRGLRVEHQLNLACRTLHAVLLMRRPNPAAPKAQRHAFKIICTEVQAWLKDEITAMRRVQPPPMTTAPERRPRPKVGHAEPESVPHPWSR